MASALLLILVTALIAQPQNTLNVFLCIGFTVVLDLIFVRLRRIPYFFPYAAVVTGIILSLTLNPSLSWPQILLVAMIAMGTKNFLRFGNRHIFNPAASGLVFGGMILAKNVSWWGVSFQSLNTPVLFIILLLPFIVSGYVMKRYLSSIMFFIAYNLLLLILNRFDLASLSSLILDPRTVFFAIVMLPEPMTSPTMFPRQFLYGLLIAVSTIIVAFTPIGKTLTSFNLLPDGLLPLLLAGNLIFFKFK